MTRSRSSEDDSYNNTQ